ncbi:TonB-dependent siderophore receptor [Myxacorys almedinensis A]|uniref:TonB-dependent siderophore receptor n=2 Tax=Myxacorys TaxID=2056239 RepID=A0A8J8CJC5_9CYAN|nr:TonB-dependent siderophore receptor [Myxacorys almedinensis A]
MKLWQVGGLAVTVSLVGMLVPTELRFALIAATGAIAAEVTPQVSRSQERDSSGSLRSNRPATTVKEWMAQVEAAQVQVTGVKLERTEAGLDIVLETAEGKPLTIDATKFRTEGNSLIAEIPNATLALPQGQPFVAENPTADVANVRVEQQAGNIRVSVAGNNALPQTEVTLKAGGLAYSLNPEADEPDEEIVVTGERGGYRVPNTSVGTRTDTPLRDIPQTIQVVPQEVLRDQNVTRLQDATRNVAGASQGGSSITDRDQQVTLRGFESRVLRNGVRDQDRPDTGVDFANIERVEVLSGPASVLFGRNSPGGAVNVVTKQPLRDPFYAVNATIGSFDFYRGAIDLSGPLNDSRTVLYRLNVAYQDRNAFVDRFDESQFFISPVISLALGDHTRLTLEGEYIDTADSFFFGLPIEGTVLPNPNGRIPRNRNTAESYVNSTLSRVGYRLEHQFSDNWSIQNVFRASFFETESSLVVQNLGIGLNPDQRTINRTRFDGSEDRQSYGLQTYLTGEFSTGSIDHQLLFGVDLNRLDGGGYTATAGRGFIGTASPIDVFNPVYGQPTGPLTLDFDVDLLTDSLGVYVQDLVTLAPNLKLLLGGQFDLFRQTTKDNLADTESTESSNAFSPRVGIVYQPIPPISLYASYARSFLPNGGTDFEGNQFQPERGTQYEVGVKADLNDQLSATLAFYNLTRSNVLTPDTRPGVPPDRFSIQVGEQRSRGFDLTLGGEILPGWSIIVGYAYIDAEVTATNDNSIPVGSGLGNVPQNSFNLWTKYEFQSGVLQGFGVGVGLFYVGERPGFFDTSYELPSYLRTDAALYYQRDRFRAAVNFRNLFNITYFESSYGRGSIFYGEPFAVQGTISWQF